MNDVYTSDKNAFLYSIRRNGKSLEKQKIFPILKTDIDKALYYANGYLCNFGKNTGCGIWIESNCDLNTNSNNGACGWSFDMNGNTLSNSTNFHVQDMELFQLKY